MRYAYQIDLAGAGWSTYALFVVLADALAWAKVSHSCEPKRVLDLNTGEALRVGHGEPTLHVVKG